MTQSREQGLGAQHTPVAEPGEDPEMNFRLMADKNRGVISRPDCTGVRPGPTG